MKSFQEIFNETYAAIIAQGVPAVTPSGSCKYRGPDNTKCAIGHHIPNDKYNGGMEGTSIRSMLVLGPNPLPDNYPLLDERTIDFYADMQNAHDQAGLDSHYNDGDFLLLFIQKMGIVASHYDLKMPV